MPQGENRAYSAYGYATDQSFSETLSGFKGELYLAVLGSYLLGNGYRIYSPHLLRFLSPDSCSPFAEGGLNHYAYCLADPINYVDPSGQFSVKQLLSRRTQPRRNSLASAGARERHPIQLAQPQPGSTQGRSVPDGFELVGYHGSSKKYQASLEAGIKPRPGDDNTMGAGFYFSSRHDIASMYGAHGPGNQHVYGVYARNFKHLEQGRDFDYLGGSKELFVVRERAFANFAVRAQIEGKLIRRNSYTKEHI
ncbi:RHS repeat-associated core domain-containing protein [Pseudomonas putida]|uniref:RHS repeat-associated core domain-containing protein n=1 Tax=Pseudomonas putida TaxID=303 RepID=A0A4D6X2Y8_PSEPU|nr:RHS repeat-associated core domain-containing protein [Pseudomonas putida]QCI10283.1 RHS repeat-associated core domain-containing protein [Pseudomonas putida]